MTGPPSRPPVRAFHHRDFDVAALVDAKAGRTVSVCFPARNEAATVGSIVRFVRRELIDHVPLVDEVIVIDDHSTDATAAFAAEAGAVVASTSALLPELGPGAGKGEALWKSLYVARGDIVLWCDADIRNFGARFVVGLLGPLLADDSIGFVKGFYERPLDGRVGEGGRVTELVARPIISLLFPTLSSIVQPLAGEYGGRRDVLEQVPFVQGYGVDLALLVDLSSKFGFDALAQVDLGTRMHRNRPLDQLSPQAMAIMQTAFVRAHLPSAEAVPQLVRPGVDPVTVPFVERPPMVDVEAYRRRHERG